MSPFFDDTSEETQSHRKALLSFRLQEISVDYPNLAIFCWSPLLIVRNSFTLIPSLQTSHRSSNTENKQENFQSKEGKEDRNINAAKRVREKVSKQKGTSESLSK